MRRARCSSSAISVLVRPAAASSAIRRSLPDSAPDPVRRAPGRGLRCRAGPARPRRAAAWRPCARPGPPPRAGGRGHGPVHRRRGAGGPGPAGPRPAPPRRRRARPAGCPPPPRQAAHRAAPGGGAQHAQRAAHRARGVPHPGQPQFLRRQVQCLLAAAQRQPALCDRGPPRGDDRTDHVAGGLPASALQEVVQRPRRVAGGGPLHAPRVQEAVQFPGLRRPAQVERGRETPGLLDAACVDERQQGVGVPVGGPGAGTRRAGARFAGQQAGVVAAGRGDVGAGVEERLVHRVQQRGVLPGQPALHEPFRLVQFVGPLGHRGGRAQQEGLGKRIGGLGEEAPYAGHRLPGRDQPGRRGVPHQQRLPGGAHQLRGVLAGLAQPPVHLLPGRQVLVGEQRARGLHGAAEARVAGQPALGAAQHLHGRTDLAAAREGGAEGDGRAHPVARVGRQVLGLGEARDGRGAIGRRVLQGAQLGQQPLPLAVVERLVQRPAQIADGVAGPGVVHGDGHRVPARAGPRAVRRPTPAAGAGRPPPPGRPGAAAPRPRPGARPPCAVAASR